MHIALSRMVVGHTLPDVPEKSFEASPLLHSILVFATGTCLPKRVRLPDTAKESHSQILSSMAFPKPRLALHTPRLGLLT